MDNDTFTTKEINTTAKELGKIIGKIIFYFISALFIWWGWNTLAPHLNSPLFSYWEIFAMRMALTYIISILWQK